jgi:hypothetical protein
MVAVAAHVMMLGQRRGGGGQGDGDCRNGGKKLVHGGPFQ